MMQFIRDKANGVVAWAIVAMIAIVFCFWGVSGYFTGGSSPTVASVYGHKISSQQVENIYTRWLHHNLAQKGFDLSQINPNYIKQQIAKSLAEQQAVIEGLQRSGFAISDRVLVATIRADAHLQEKGQFSMDLYKRYLQNIGMPEAEFEELRRNDLMAAQVQQGVISSSFSLTNEVQRVLDIKNQKRSFGYSVISAASLSNAQKPSDADIQQYYAQHVHTFTEPEKVKIEYIELSVDGVRQQVQITEQKLRDYYQNNVQSFSEPEQFHLRHIMVSHPQSTDPKLMAAAKAKIDGIYARLQSGENFSTLAKTESEDNQTAADGGDLGWNVRGSDLPPAAYSMKSKNAYTPVVETSYAWHIFQLVDTKPAIQKPFEQVRKTIEARYRKETEQSLFNKQAEELANLSFEHPQSLAPVSSALGLKIQTTDFFDRTAKEGLVGAKNLQTAVFSDDVLKKRNNSDLIKISDDSYLVLRVTDTVPQRTLPLEDVREQIIAKLRDLAARAKAAELGQKLLSEIKQSTDANLSGLKKSDWRVLHSVERDAKGIPSAILQRVFSMSKPNVGSLSTDGFTLANGDYVVIALKDVVISPSKESDSSEFAEVARQLAMLRGRFEYSSITADLIDKAKIKYNTPQD